jgi:hypothetical protein
MKNNIDVTKPEDLASIFTYKKAETKKTTKTVQPDVTDPKYLRSIFSY